MIKFFLIFMIAQALMANESLEWINHKISQISEQRNGVKKNDIIALTNPFYLEPVVQEQNNTIELKNEKEKIVVKEEIQEIEKAPLELSAIVNNYVKINSKWYNVGNDIEGYVIKKAFSNYIILQQDKELIKLYVNKKNENITIKKH